MKIIIHAAQTTLYFISKELQTVPQLGLTIWYHKNTPVKLNGTFPSGESGIKWYSDWFRF